MANQTIAEGLNLSEEWAVVNRVRVEKSLERNDTISDVIAECIEDVRNDELGETNTPITAYEKKLAMMGFHLAQEMLSNRMSGAVTSMTSLSELLRKLKRDE